MSRVCLSTLSLAAWPVILCVLAAVPVTANAQWSQAASPNVPFAEEALAADEVGNIYSFTGRSTVASFNVNLDSAYRYNVCSNSWTQIANFPYATRGNRAVHHPNGFIYVTAGIGGKPGDLYRYNATTNTYTELAAAPTATNSWELSLTVDGQGLIHWIGGEDWGY